VARALNAIILLLSLVAFASSASMRVTDALLPRIASEYGVGLAAASAVVTAFSITYGAMQLIFGPLGDRFGKLRVIACAAGGAAIASLGCFVADGYQALVVARAVAGGCFACIIPLAMAWIGDVVPYEERQPVLARFLIGQIMGIAGGAALGGLAAQSASWSWPFAVFAVWLASGGAALAVASRRDPAPRGAASRFFPDIAEVLRGAWPRVVLVTVFAEGMVVTGAIAFVPSHLHYVRGMELAAAGSMLVAFGLGGVGFALAVRRVVRRLGERGLAAGGTLSLCAALALLALVPWAAAAAVACLVAGFGFYMLHNTLQTNATQMAPRRRGAGMALFATSYFMGQSAGVAIAGAAAQAWGTTAVLIGAAVLVLPVGLAFARLIAAQPEAA
jgi:predicted MFS family arabinose efflux permease